MASTSIAVAGSIANNGKKYRVRWASAAGETVSNQAALSVQSVVFTLHPESQDGVLAGEQVTFTAEAIGDPSPSYEWQYSVDGGATWTTSASTGTSFTSDPIEAAWDYRVRVLASDSNGTAQSETAAVTFLQGLSGGTETTYFDGTGYYRIHTFTDVGEHVLKVGTATDVEYLVVAGGGSGGARTLSGGGGGAGGMLTNFNTGVPLALLPGYKTVTVGAGGPNTGVNGNGAGGGLSGSPSVLDSITASGGGGGGAHQGVAQSGGSGGGGGPGQNASIWSPGSGTPGQGKNGGFGSTSTSYSTVRDVGKCGGGGGAGSVGGNAPAIGSPATTNGGGSGLACGISGEVTYYAGGGGGGAAAWMGAGAGGVGGGGNGSQNLPTAGHGVANTGGGGGGGYNTPTTSGLAGAGGSGIVIVRYEITEAEYLAGTGA